MLSVTPKHKVYLAVQAIDFRSGIDGLSALCRTQFALDPFSGHCFIFRNRKASAVKVLIYDSQGFVFFTSVSLKALFDIGRNHLPPLSCLIACNCRYCCKMVILQQ